jgi:hypothetical protein
MEQGWAILLAALIVLVILVVAAAIWYYFPSRWEEFHYKGTTPYSSSGPKPTWTTGNSAARLRFARSEFTVTDPDGKTHTQNVTSILNGMATAYKDAKVPPSELVLDRPLNAFSFVIPGVNDSTTVSSSKTSDWKNCATSLTGRYTTL